MACVCVGGGGGTGKSYRVKSLIKGKPRVLIWDLMQEYSGTPVDGDMRKLLAIVKKKRFSIAYRPNFKTLEQDFDRFCRLAMAVGSMYLIIEELNKVTQPGHAPASWQDVTSRGRHRGLKIIGASQRPSSVDKDFISNMTECYAGRMAYNRDWQSLQCIMGDEAKKIPTLKSHKQIHWKA